MGTWVSLCYYVLSAHSYTITATIPSITLALVPAPDVGDVLDFIDISCEVAVMAATGVLYATSPTSTVVWALNAVSDQPLVSALSVVIPEGSDAHLGVSITATDTDGSEELFWELVAGIAACALGGDLVRTSHARALLVNCHSVSHTLRGC